MTFDGLEFIYFIIITRESCECDVSLQEVRLDNYGLFLKAQTYLVRFLNGRVSCIEEAKSLIRFSISKINHCDFVIRGLPRTWIECIKVVSSVLTGQICLRLCWFE